MRLYHFLKACHAVDDVEKKRVKISLWMDVNDPWELNAGFPVLDPGDFSGLGPP